MQQQWTCKSRVLRHNSNRRTFVKTCVISHCLIDGNAQPSTSIGCGKRIFFPRRHSAPCASNISPLSLLQRSAFSNFEISSTQHMCSSSDPALSAIAWRQAALKRISERSLFSERRHRRESLATRSAEECGKAACVALAWRCFRQEELPSAIPRLLRGARARSIARR